MANTQSVGCFIPRFQKHKELVSTVLPLHPFKVPLNSAEDLQLAMVVVYLNFCSVPF